MSIPNHYIDDKERELIFKLQNLAIDRYGSIRGLARACHMNRKIMDRVQKNGVYSLTSFSVIKLCYALRITPNQFYGFEPLPKVEPKKTKWSDPIKIDGMSYREVHHRLNDILFKNGGKR